jgi:type II secretory pathway component PulC
MKANVLIAAGFIVLAGVLTFLNWKGVIKNSALDRIEKAGSLVAVLLAVVAFVNPFGGQPEVVPANQVTFGDDAHGNVVAQSQSGDVIIGDTSTNADYQYANALASVKDELRDNFTSMAVALQAVASNPPESFWDTRRANETELAYQDRATAVFRDYRQEIDQYVQLLSFSKSTFNAFQRDLAYDAEQAQHVKDAYAQQDQALSSLTSYVSGLQHEISLGKSDVERAASSLSLHKEKIAAARMALAAAAARYCLIADQEDDLAPLAEVLHLAGLSVDLSPGDAGYRAATQQAAVYAAERAKVLGERLAVQTQAQAREIDRRVTDPYLLLLREAVGLPPTLTITEVVHLQNTDIDEDETDPVRLFELAQNSYLESDGRAAVDYFRRAIATGQTPKILELYAEISIDRLENPDKYDGSIGLMVLKLVPGGNFEASGVLAGDVIIALNGEVANDPLEVASALLETEPLLLTIIRDGQKSILPIDGGTSAGAGLSQLIMLNAVQL